MTVRFVHAPSTSICLAVVCVVLFYVGHCNVSIICPNRDAPVCVWPSPNSHELLVDTQPSSMP